jgi:hypothetical protein
VIATVAAIAAPTKSAVCFIDDSPLEIPRRKRRLPGILRLQKEFSQELPTGAI